MSNSPGILNVHYIMLAIDLLATGLDIALLKINKIKGKA
jgi:hypothetical protein